MKQKFKKIFTSRVSLILIFVLAFIVRIVNLSSVPNGFSINEIKIGIFFESLIANYPKNLLFVRLPFFVLGLISIYLCYKLFVRIFSEKQALIGILFLAILPWHIYLSRVGSLGIVIFVLTLLLIILLVRQFDIYKLGIALIIFSFLVFLYSVLADLKEVAIQVNDERLLASMSEWRDLSFLTNKLTVSFRNNISDIFQHLDFGNYFFLGQPRLRLGVEEIRKAYLFMIPLLFLGIFKTSKKNLVFLAGLACISISSVLLLNLNGPSENVLFMVPLITLASKGLMAISSFKRKYVFNVFIFLMVFESFFFLNRYHQGLDESRHSPYKPLYQKMVSEVESSDSIYERVLVNDRIKNSELAFRYLYQGDLSKFDFISFKINTEGDKDTLYVDFLPGDPNPSEQLYSKDGSYPSFLNLLEDFVDNKTRDRVVIYEYRK